jgi:hypothetical protein
MSAQNNDPNTNQPENAERAESAESAESATGVSPTQTLPSEIYNLLPQSLKAITDLIDRPVDRDIFLTGALPVLAGSMLNVRTKYGSHKHSLNVYTCIVADAGSGKGKMRLARRLGRFIHEDLITESQKQREEWESDLRSGPTPPDFRSFYLAGDASAAGLKQSLEANPHGVIFETEITTLTNVLIQDWGTFRDVLLKGLQNEPITLKRKDIVPVHLPHPAFSIALSGTPGSFREIINSTEDGLFSRFLFYSFSTQPEFINQFTSAEDEQLIQEIDTAATQLHDLYGSLQNRSSTLWVELDKSHQQLIVSVGERLTRLIESAGLPSSLHANVRRAALSTIRIAGIMAIVRRLEGDTDLSEIDRVTPSYDDVQIGMLLTSGYLDHALKIQGALSGKSSPVQGISTTLKKRFYRSLPHSEFATHEAVDIAIRLGIPERTAQKYLKDFVHSDHLEHVAHGSYRRPGVVGGCISCTSLIFDTLADFSEENSEENADQPESQSTPEGPREDLGSIDHNSKPELESDDRTPSGEMASGSTPSNRPSSSGYPSSGEQVK